MPGVLAEDVATLIMVLLRSRTSCRACGARRREVFLRRVLTAGGTCEQFSSRKDERKILLSTRRHGVKAADRGFLAETITSDPKAAAAQSY